MTTTTLIVHLCNVNIINIDIKEHIETDGKLTRSLIVGLSNGNYI